MNKRIVVLGGTGFVGQHACEKLIRAGWQVTVPTRRLASAKAIQHLPGLTVREVDVHDGQALRDLLAGHQAALNLVAILHGDEAAFERTHVRLAQTLAQACLDAGIGHLVHVSALGVAEDGPSRYQRSKARGEAVLRASGVPLTILRPSVIFGAGDRFLNLFARLQRIFPVMPLAGARTRFQPVWVEDVAQAIATCLDTGVPRPGSKARIIECAGPDILSLAELVQVAGRHGSRARPVLPMPDVLGRLQALAMECLPGEPLMSRDNLDSMKEDNVASGLYPGLESLGIRPASVHAIAPTYLKT